MKSYFKPRILLVEDNEVNRKIVIAMLKYHDLSFDVATDGKEVIKAVIDENYDIILMDCQMPVMDGFESTAKIRELEGNKKHTPIIAMTANAMEGDREKCIQAGMDDYLCKPINFDAVFKLIDEYSNKRIPKFSDLIDDNIDSFAASTGLNKDVAKEIFTNFIESLPGIFKSIDVALNEMDYISIKNLSHNLKGTTGNLRIESFYSLVLELKNSAQNKDLESCKSVFADIKKMFT